MKDILGKAVRVPMEEKHKSMFWPHYKARRDMRLSDLQQNADGSEYMSLTEAAKEGIYLTKLLKELGSQQILRKCIM